MTSLISRLGPRALTFGDAHIDLLYVYPFIDVMYARIFDCMYLYYISQKKIDRSYRRLKWHTRAESPDRAGGQQMSWQLC